MSKKPTNLFRTNQPVYADSVLTANKNLPWVKNLVGRKAVDPQLVYNDGFVYPTAGEDRTAIAMPEEQGVWFAGGGMKQARGVMGNYGPNKVYALGTSSSDANAELEGDELIQTPNGEVSEVQGASHEQGGVDANLPQGTKVYSDRIKIGDHTIADRKKYRTGMIKKFLENLGGKTDGLSHNTLKRNLAFFKLQEEHDLAVQNLAKEALQPQGETQKLAYGTYGYEDPLTKNWRYSAPAPWQMSDTFSIPFLQDTPITAGADEVVDMKPIKGKGIYKDGIAPEKSFTAGDWVGLGGMAVGAITQMSNTIQNAKSTKPAVNYWEGFNAEALATNQEAMDELGYQKDIAVRDMDRDLSIATNNARARNRNSSMGMNTSRSLDLATDLGVNEASIKGNNQLEATFGQQKLSLLGQKVGLQTQADQMERAGQDRMDEINQANLDAFYTNFGQNLADMSTNIQQVGGMINQSKENKDFLSTLAMANKWGVGVKRVNGKLVLNIE